MKYIKAIHHRTLKVSWIFSKLYGLLVLNFLVDFVYSSFAQFTKTVKFEEVNIELSILSSTQIA